MTMANTDRVELSRTLAERLSLPREPGDEKAFADTILAQLREDRLLWVVADDDNAPALSIGDTARITFNIARLSGSAGLIYAMHMSQALTLVRHGGDSPFFSALLRRMVREQVLVASGTSEKGVGGDIFGSICTIEESGGGLSVTKESPNISYLDHAGLILVSAMRIQENGKKAQVLVAAETKDIDLQPGRAAGFMGMRGILNRPYGFTARFDEAAIFAETYPVIARDTMTPSIHIFWAALWSGLAASALDKVRACIGKSPPAESDVADVMRSELSRLVDKHYAMNALIRDAVAAFDDKESVGAMGMAHTADVKRLKVLCSDYLTEICLGALGLLGIRGYADEGGYSLSEILRDALSARVMISNYRLLTSNAKIERFVEERL
jgi:acyl-CoA dehydrogenase